MASSDELFPEEILGITEAVKDSWVRNSRMRLGEFAVGLSMQSLGLWFDAEGVDALIHNEGDVVGNLLAGGIYLGIGIAVAIKFGKYTVETGRDYLDARNNANRLKAKVNDLRTSLS